MQAVPDHHTREKNLKQKKMKELASKNKKKKPARQPGDVDFEKMFGKDIDEFLEDSDWDIESFDRMSQYSKGTARSVRDGTRLRGLESIYLQRLETSMKKGHQKTAKKKVPKFRVLQDRFIDDPEYIHQGEAPEEAIGDSHSSGRRMKVGKFAESAHTTSMGQKKDGLNMFSGHRYQYDPNQAKAPDFNKNWA